MHLSSALPILALALLTSAPALAQQTAPRPIQPNNQPRTQPTPRNQPRAQPRTQPRNQPRAQPRNAEPEGERSAALGAFWTAFPPPGDYNIEIGLAGGTNFLETAYGESNPNLLLRGHVGFRPLPGQVPVWIFGAVDYNSYEQSAGPLVYTNNNIFMGLGGGALGYIGSLRLDAALEGGALIRNASQTDGKNEFSNTDALPAIGFIGGVGFSILGYVTLSLRAGSRYYLPNGIGNDGRLDVSVLGGLEILIGGTPVDYY